jgi:hypothetical protein
MTLVLALLLCLGVGAIAGVLIVRGPPPLPSPVRRGRVRVGVRWRQHFHDEPFARRDRRYYSPFCLLLGVGDLALLAGEMERP